MVEALASGAQETVSRSLPLSSERTPIPYPVCPSFPLWASPPGAIGLASSPDSEAFWVIALSSVITGWEW